MVRGGVSHTHVEQQRKGHRAQEEDELLLRRRREPPKHPLPALGAAALASQIASPTHATYDVRLSLFWLRTRWATGLSGVCLYKRVCGRTHRRVRQGQCAGQIVQW